MNLVNIKIDKIIMHEVYKRDINKNIVQPRYSNNLSTLSVKGIETLEERIIDVMGKNSYCMEMDILKTEKDSFLSLINKLINSNNDQYIIESRKVADKLAEAQSSRRIPGGMVVVIQGTIGVSSLKRFICIIKAEIHNGFTRDDNLVLQYLSDLVLTPTQKLYKIAFYIEESRDISLKLEDRYSLLVYDQNMKRADTKDVATYFYSSFLESNFKQNSKITTRNFYEITKDYINDMNVTDEEKVDMNMNLYTYVNNSENLTLSAEEFATQYMPANSRDNYKNYLYDKNIPEASFSKDISYIKNKLKQRRIKFTNNISITIPSENYKDSFKIIESSDDSTIIEIKGKLKEQQ